MEGGGLGEVEVCARALFCSSILPSRKPLSSSQEANVVVDLIRELLRSTSVKVGTEDIGVIAGFRRQVLKLRRLLREKGLGSVNVGQVTNEN